MVNKIVLPRFVSNDLDLIKLKSPFILYYFYENHFMK